jgi:hypothetical protein
MLVQTRTQPLSGFDVLFGFKKPVDVLDLHAAIRRDGEPLYHAWALVWTTGSPEAIPIANALLKASGEVISEATIPGRARGPIRTRLFGQKWTQEQLDELNKRAERVAELRRQLAELARRELGHEVADLWA